MAIIDKPSDYFNTVLYTGTGLAGQAQTGVGFQPDLVWTKSRSNTYPHQWYDVIRGVTQRLQSNDTSAEATQSNGLTAFGTDGFTVGDASGTGVSGATYASWNWKANGTGVANTDGTISSTVSANTTSGFSVITFTGDGNANATVGHGLGVAPKMVIVKSRSAATGWFVYHASLTTGDNIYLDDTGAAFGGSYVFDVTSTVFTLRDHTAVNGNGVTFVAYCFADTSMSKMGSYTGNGNADGTFVYTGFKPAFILQKNTTTVGTGWGMIDNKRTPFNVSKGLLLANSNAVEDTSAAPSIDFLSNGFKWRTTDSWFNQSGVTNIYMAFAENPFTTSTAIPACAR
jgi:hypothetical protein